MTRAQARARTVRVIRGTNPDRRRQYDSQLQQLAQKSYWPKSTP